MARLSIVRFSIVRLSIACLSTSRLRRRIQHCISNRDPGAKYLTYKEVFPNFLFLSFVPFWMQRSVISGGLCEYLYLIPAALEKVIKNTLLYVVKSVVPSYNHLESRTHFIIKAYY